MSQVFDSFNVGVQVRLPALLIITLITRIVLNSLMCLLTSTLIAALYSHYKEILIHPG